MKQALAEMRTADGRGQGNEGNKGAKRSGSARVLARIGKLWIGFWRGQSNLSCRLRLSIALARLVLLVPSLLRPVLFHFEHQALEVFGLGQVEDDGMVGSGAAALEQAHAARCIGGGRGDGGFEIGPAT